MSRVQIGSHIIFAFSDTHGNHRRLKVPEDADIIICAGDDVEVLEPMELRNNMSLLTKSMCKKYEE